MSAEPRPSDAEIREAAKKGVTVYALRLSKGARVKRAPKVPIIRTYQAPLGTGERHGDTLCAIFHTTARSKKNSRRLIVRTGKDGKVRQHFIPSLAYEAFANEIETAVMGLRAKCRLPLPSCPYSMSVVFFMPSDQADVDNLVVGLNDALQAAGVFENDRQIRHVEASATIDADNPRIALTLSPLAP